MMHKFETGEILHTYLQYSIFANCHMLELINEAMLIESLL